MGSIGVLLSVVLALDSSCSVVSAQKAITQKAVNIVQNNLNAVLLLIAAAFVLFMQMNFTFLETGVCLTILSLIIVTLFNTYKRCLILYSYV